MALAPALPLQAFSRVGSSLLTRFRAGANVKEVSVWAGHSSVAFTLDRYGHLYDDADDDTSDRLDALLKLTEQPTDEAPVVELPTRSKAD
jgi:hypothetical protein